MSPEISSVEKGSDALSGEKHGSGQVGPMRRSQRQVDRETRQTVAKIRAENQEFIGKENPSIGKGVIAGGRVKGRGWSRSRPRRQSRVPRDLANLELSSSRVSAESESEDPDKLFIDEFVAPPDVTNSSLKRTAACSVQTPSQPRPRGRRKSFYEGAGGGGQEGGKVKGKIISCHLDMEMKRLCKACGATLAPDETLPEHIVSIHLTTAGVCDICGEDAEDICEHFKTHLEKSDEEVASQPMVTVKEELLLNGDFNQTLVVKKEPNEEDGRMVRNPFFSPCSGGSNVNDSNDSMMGSGAVRSPTMQRIFLPGPRVESRYVDTNITFYHFFSS